MSDHNLPMAVDRRFYIAFTKLFPGEAPEYRVEQKGDEFFLTDWNVPGDPPSAEAVTAALLAIDWDAKRRERNAILQDTDYIWQRHSEQKAQGAATSYTDEQIGKLLTWREAIRNALKIAPSPDQVEFPPQPVFE